MGLLFLILMLVAIGFFILGRKSGAILALIVLFPEMTGIILNSTGMEGLNMLFRYLLYVIVIVMNIGNLKTGFKRLVGDPVTLFFYAMIATMLVLNMYIVGRARYDSDVSSFQMNVILRVLVPYLVILLTLNTKKNVSDFCLSVPVWGLLFFLTFFLLIGMDGVVIEDRMSLEEATGIGPIELSRFSGIILVSLWVFILDSRAQLQPLYIAMLLVGIFLLLLSSQRGSIIGVAFAVFLVLYFFLIKKGRAGTMVIAVAFLMIVVYLLMQQFHFSFLNRFRELEDFEESNRFLDFGFSWEAFSKNHYFWGLGSKGYYYFMDEMREYPHNFVLEQMVEYGIVGLCFAIVLIVRCVKAAFRVLRNILCPEYVKCIPAMWIMIFASVLVSGNFVNNALFMVITAALICADICYRDDYELQKPDIHKRS